MRPTGFARHSASPGRSIAIVRKSRPRAGPGGSDPRCSSEPQATVAVLERSGRSLWDTHLRSILRGYMMGYTGPPYSLQPWVCHRASGWSTWSTGSRGPAYDGMGRHRHDWSLRLRWCTGSSGRRRADPYRRPLLRPCPGIRGALPLAMKESRSKGWSWLRWRTLTSPQIRNVQGSLSCASVGNIRRFRLKTIRAPMGDGGRRPHPPSMTITNLRYEPKAQRAVEIERGAARSYLWWPDRQGRLARSTRPTIPTGSQGRVKLLRANRRQGDPSEAGAMLRRRGHRRLSANVLRSLT